jgi:hypothetical protein
MNGMAKAMWVTFGISLAVSLLLAAAFIALASLAAEDSGLARWGGAAWVFILSFIIALPAMAPIIKRRLRG